MLQFENSVTGSCRYCNVQVGVLKVQVQVRKTRNGKYSFDIYVFESKTYSGGGFNTSLSAESTASTIINEMIRGIVADARSILGVEVE